MESKSLSISSDILFPVLLMILLAICLGCETGDQTEYKGNVEKSYDYQAKPVPDQETDVKPKPAPQALAAIQLTQQARQLLHAGQIDDAISLLERALNLNPSNGQNYYYLAEAWYAKKNWAQAKEFNRLAELYFQDDPDWTEKIRLQRLKIMNH